MKNSIKLLAVILFTFAFVAGKAQKNDDFSKRLCKEWKLASYEDDGELFPPAPEHVNDRMTFTTDNRVISVEKGITTNGIWQYDAQKKNLIITTDAGPIKMYKLEVKKLSDNELILEYEDEDSDDSIIMHFTPVDG